MASGGMFENARAMAEPKEVPQAALDGHTLVAHELVKDYGDGLGVQGVNLVIDAGDVVMLVGPNGAGKSTFLGVCAGLIEPNEGGVWVNAHQSGTLGARAATTYIPDQPVLYDDLSVNEHLAYIAKIHGTEGWDEYADDLLEMFRLTDRADDLPSRFSRGLRQKTALLCGLIRPFDVILIDEPFAGLDRPAQETLVSVMADIASDGAAVICSTHQLDLIEVATRCVGLQDGKVVYDGNASEKKIRDLTSG